MDEIAFNCNVNTFYNLLVDKSIDSIWLESTAFKDFSRLTELNLSRNKLKSLNSKLFQDLISLTKIDLSYNQLQSIDSRLFKGLTCLTHIWLNNNQLSTINTKLFKGLNNLTHIWLNDNNWLSDNLELYIESSLEFISFKKDINDINYEEVSSLPLMQPPPLSNSSSLDTVNIISIFIHYFSKIIFTFKNSNNFDKKTLVPTAVYKKRI